MVDEHEQGDRHDELDRHEYDPFIFHARPVQQEIPGNHRQRQGDPGAEGNYQHVKSNPGCVSDEVSIVRKGIFCH
jgi:hypothetical protein